VGGEGKEGIPRTRAPAERGGEKDAHLDNLVPSSGDDDRVHGVGGEADAGNPLGVTLLLNVELALAEGVPELDGAVTGTGDDLTVVGGEGNREDVGGVANEATGGESRVEVPETEGLVPRGGEGELAVGGDDNVGDEAVVAVEDTLGVTERRLSKNGVRSVCCLFSAGRVACGRMHSLSLRRERRDRRLAAAMGGKRRRSTSKTPPPRRPQLCPKGSPVRDEEASLSPTDTLDTIAVSGPSLHLENALRLDLLHLVSASSSPQPRCPNLAVVAGSSGGRSMYLVTGEGPHDDGLVARGGQDHVGVLGRGGDRRDIAPDRVERCEESGGSGESKGGEWDE
jgi:hypothetical protein